MARAKKKPVSELRHSGSLTFRLTPSAKGAHVTLPVGALGVPPDSDMGWVIYLLTLNERIVDPRVIHILGADHDTYERVRKILLWLRKLRTSELPEFASARADARGSEPDPGHGLPPCHPGVVARRLRGDQERHAADPNRQP